MNKIRILSETLANKIAAGEVVERPASVVKELVENSLDAESTRITIEIEKGGRSLIQVADNGIGMNHDDALLALERFATSKIHTDSDLFSIQTLGFRGEALPSLASVSKMTLVTRRRNSDSGVAVRIHGGKILEVSDAGAPAGTMISVAQLFYNTPARRKFLKSINTEMGHISDVVAAMALGRPQVHFKLIHNARVVKQWPKVSDPAQRVAEVLGRVDSRSLVPLSVSSGDLKLSGHLGPSRLARSTSRGIYLYVNGRRVRDLVIQHAVFEGYSGRLVKGQYPLAVLFLELPFDQVDVNVHPTKHEIRFADQRRVHNSVRDHVAKALAESERKLWQVPETPPPVKEREIVADAVPTYRISSKTPPHEKSAPDEPFVYKAGAVSEPSAPVRGNPLDAPVVNPRTRVDENTDPSLPRQSGAQQKLWQEAGFADLKVIGQFHGTYIICQSPQGLILIDQHAAHERIVYEQLKGRAGRIESQRLLMPETVEVGFAEAQILSELIPPLNEWGLELEPFGGNTFVVKSVPTVLKNYNMPQIIIELAERAADIGLETGLEKVLDQCRMVMACHHSVRANQRLTDEQIGHLLTQLDQCDDPSHCPHGRPTWIQWTVKDLDKAFKRIVH
ncbi:MAG: DNA mismatch repair endonuclease MutL [Desulfobacteraceae bacterium]|jgi:DNA mismatch repair protein MutL